MAVAVSSGSIIYLVICNEININIVKNNVCCKLE